MLKNLKQFSIPETEEEVLRFWKKAQIFKKSLKNRQDVKAREFVFYEGPPTANGRPGIHHVETRAFKDVVLRYKTMRGFYVPRRAGWDTHGLPVEIEVEKELGLRDKKDIEKFGISEFNSRCKDLVWKYRSDWERLTERMGFWIDLENPYITYQNNYMESVWWILSRVYRRGFLKKMLRIVPWCGRCQTVLSSHELGQPGVYKEVLDPSAYVKFRLKRSKKTPEFFLAWTTTPWTLSANLALAVNPRLTYTKFLIKDLESGKKEYLWSYNAPPELAGKEVSVAEKISGRKLVGFKYEPLYSIATPKGLKNPHEVRPADFVQTDEGSGVVHVAPSFGEDDFSLLDVREDLPQTVDDSGRVMAGYVGAGKPIKEADSEVLQDLKKRNLLYFSEKKSHEYPHCWRCSNPLIYMARTSWFIQMSKLRKKLIKANSSVNWIPSHVKEGRFGEWIKEAKDWAISRSRYWGIPLPVWECSGCQEPIVVKGLSDLDNHRGTKNSFFTARHGEATSNVGGWVASGTEKGKKISVLTKKGEEQIKRLARSLKRKEIDIIYASPYKRIQQTAKIIAKELGVKIITDERLGEIQVGPFSGGLDSEYKSYFASESDRFYNKPPGRAETLTEVRGRAVDFVCDINRKNDKKKILILSHGDVLWLMDSAMQGFSNEETIASEYYPENGELKRLEVHNWPFDEEGLVNLHRPFVDEIRLSCPHCGKNAHRVKDVMDVWFDSGAMPFASSHFPFSYGKKESLPSGKKLAAAYKEIPFPADYIAEALDQTRGWFYTLLAISSLLDQGAPYKNVICLGLTLDKNGQKMSKSKGNVVIPAEMISKYGIDSVRWYFYTVNDPGDPKRFDEQELAKIVRRFMLILYNSFVFWNSYGKRHETQKSAYEASNVLDRWILAKLNILIQKSTKKMDAYYVGEAGRLIETFSDDLSRWYIRRSRERFKSAARGVATDQRDWEEASFTLQTVLLTLTKLIAPMMPFFAEALYKSLGGARESVHLDDWPTADIDLIDKELVTAMDSARKLAAEALALRAHAKIKVRQPLAELTVADLLLEDYPKIVELLKEEVNVKKISFDKRLRSKIHLNTAITPELREEGVARELSRAIQGLRQEAGYKMSDEIFLYVHTDENLANLIQRHAVNLRRSVNAKVLELKKSDNVNAFLETKIDGLDCWIGVQKV